MIAAFRDVNAPLTCMGQTEVSLALQALKIKRGVPDDNHFELKVPVNILREVQPSLLSLGLKRDISSVFTGALAHESVTPTITYIGNVQEVQNRKLSAADPRFAFELRDEIAKRTSGSRLVNEARAARAARYGR